MLNDEDHIVILTNNLFFFVSSAIIGLFGSFTIEKFKRLSFNQQRMILEEKEKSDNLLLNILPVRVAFDLKNYGSSEPILFENVTVFFSDIVGFTDLSNQVDAKFLIHELNELFTGFDDIMIENNCERIKTIGDAYLAVSGMHNSDSNHAENISNAALQIVEFCKQRNMNNLLKWEVRIGIHTGKVVGGIVGTKKYIYDVFGDTVNIASRLETNSEPMQINVSAHTQNLLKDKFHFEQRESIKIKGIEFLEMYYLNGRK